VTGILKNFAAGVASLPNGFAEWEREPVERCDDPRRLYFESDEGKEAER